MITFQNYEHAQLAIRQSSGDQFAYNSTESTNLLFEFIKPKELIELQIYLPKKKHKKT